MWIKNNRVSGEISPISVVNTSQVNIKNNRVSGELSAISMNRISAQAREGVLIASDIVERCLDEPIKSAMVERSHQGEGIRGESIEGKTDGLE